MGKRRKDKLDRILVIDLEATCWEDGAPNVPERENWETNDIIEIGQTWLRLVGETWTVGESKSTFVRPTSSRVSRFCTELTSITPEQAAGGIPFFEAMRQLSRDAQGVTWASWGEYDRRQIERQCDRERKVHWNLDYPMGRSHINAKRLFNLCVPPADHVSERDLGEAIHLLSAKNICPPFQGRHHRADADSLNVATVLAVILNATSGIMDVQFGIHDA